MFLTGVSCQQNPLPFKLKSLKEVAVLDNTNIGKNRWVGCFGGGLIKEGAKLRKYSIFWF